MKNNRFLAVGFFVLASLFLGYGNIISTTHAAPPQGFVNQLLLSNLSQPTDFAFPADGRIFILQKLGQVMVDKNGQLLTTPAVDLSTGGAGIATGGDRGLLSIALDPNFSANGYVYLLYTTAASHERLSRFTFSGDAISPTSELILFENPEVWSGFLNAGTVRYNPVDGKLYLTLGSNGGGAISQDLSSFDGKLLRLNLDGSIPADNPFVSIQGAQGLIWSYGFRNPWKMNIDPKNGTAIIGDVGVDTWEKIVRSAKGANFGWPMFEGDCRPNCNGVTPPLYVYNHNGAGAAVLGGDIYSGTLFPAQYQHNYFYGDYVKGYINELILDANGNVTATSSFDIGLGALSGIETGPDGCLYYLTIFPGTFHRECYGNPAPVLNAFISSNVYYGALPLAVNFSSAGSNDSSGTALNYSWNFGDGSTSAAANPSHTYNQKGVYTVTLTISNADGSASQTYKIWAGYFPPSAMISSPASTLKWNAGDTLNFSGSATDPQDGTLGASSFDWQIIFHHNTHIHPPTEYVGVNQGTYVIPTEPHTETVDLAYEFRLTVTDSVGLATTVSTIINPNVVTLNIFSNPSGLELLLDSQPTFTPYTAQAIPGYIHAVDAPSPNTLNGTSYNFTSWSDGGAESHDFAMPTVSSIYTANYSAGGGGGGTQNITSTAATDAPSYNPGQALFVNATITDTANLNNAVVDIEMWNSAGKVSQSVTPENFVANQPVNISWNTIAPATAGTYTIKIGVFSSDWTTMYAWNNLAATFSVGSGGGGGGGTLSFTSSATTDAASYTGGAAEKITTTVSATQNVSNLVLDTEVWNAGGKVLQNVVPLSLTANTPASFIWNTTAPATAGSYTLKIGIFAADWSKLYSWNDTAGTFTVGSGGGGGGGGPLVITDNVILDASSYTAGSSVALITSVTPNQTVASSTVLDTEIYNSTGTKILQNVVPVTLTANQTSSSTWNFAAPANGTYTVKDGVFASDWSKLYSWDDNAASLVVGGTPSPSPSPTIFVVSASMPSNAFPPGSNTNETTKVTASNNISVNIDTEIDNPSGVMVMQNVVAVNLVANQQFANVWNLTLPSSPTGNYSIKIGIFSPDWTQIYFWQNRAFQFTLGNPPPPPQPGQTYTVSVLQPADGATVSGTYEVRAVINGLDINSYNIGWRTGSGTFFNLDTDPVTQSFKHAWIDFSAWNWSPNNVYPLEFEATDVNNNVIGDTKINVTVQH